MSADDLPIITFLHQQVDWTTVRFKSSEAQSSWICNNDLKIQKCPSVNMANGRYEHLVRFYSILDKLEAMTGPERSLCNCSGSMDWPERGVYFFREPSEQRTDTGAGPRIVRVGSLGLKEHSRATLWKRLSQHKGQTTTGGGNHRGSIFRLLVGTALVERDHLDYPTWGHGNSASKEIRRVEDLLEMEVSSVIGKMPFLWIEIGDDAGRHSLRGYIEKNAIALLSNHNKHVIDPASPDWLGRSCNRERVRNSGLWNSNHVDDHYDAAFLGELDGLVRCFEVAQ